MLAYIHASCGQIAFLLTQMPKTGERASSRIARHLDGRPMEYGSRPACDSCGHPIYEAFSIKHIRNMPDMAPANARRLVSRNKREGWYAGKDGWSKGQHYRAHEKYNALRWMYSDIERPPGYVMFFHEEAAAAVRKRISPKHLARMSAALGTVGTVFPDGSVNY